ncbi:MAG: transglutaminase domain-containing protein [Bacteroidota bacterium]
MKTLLIPGMLIFLIISGCRNDHFITDKSYREKVEKQFEKQKELAKNRSQQLFGVFGQRLTLREKEALEFLYAYAPLSDLADYDGEFFLHNVRASFAAKDTFSWGKTVPEELFRHFVLPVRVNNENLDSSRWVFFMELKDHIKKLPMKEAVLEVNHWCHEKVTYRGSDGRTSSPLASVKTAYGRCGEESTLTVAALRSVGIPARQCYTPRWAHSDDNHAWVEVWVNGKWHFIGACEPDVDLDLAWFTAPAKRAMLVNTNVFGDYQGPEDVLVRDTRFTRINVLSNYAATRRIVGKVVDEQKRPVDSATIEFQLYNYAEFYTLHKTVTDKQGLASFQTGHGDLLIWAAKKGVFGFTKVTVASTDTALIVLSLKPGAVFTQTLDLVPPPEITTGVKVSDSLKALNTTRLEFEDKLRADYESTFIDSSKSFRLAHTLKLNGDTLWSFLKKSRGNWRGIIDFITSTPEKLQPYIFPLLANVSEKDLRDVTPDVLTDQVSGIPDMAISGVRQDMFREYILSPRVDNEWLKPFKTLFREKTDAASIGKFRKNPEELVKWIRSSITADNTANWSRAPLTPAGVFELKVADGHSRDILFVAMCRSFGIPARLESGTRVPQYFFLETWHDVFFEKHEQESNSRGSIVLTSAPANERKPEYYTHFTIEKYDDGFFRSLDYETDPRLGNFPCTLSVAPGSYMMVTGNRIQGGTVLATLQCFTLGPGQTVPLAVSLRKNQIAPPVYGRINTTLPGYTVTKGMILIWVDPDKEPTKHLFADLRQMKTEFEGWKGTFVLVFPTEDQMKIFRQKEAASIPSTISYSFETIFPVKLADCKLAVSSIKNSPVALFISPDGVINYLSDGYKIGIGEELMKMIKWQNGKLSR